MLFTSQVDEAPLRDEAKLAYLKELVQPKVRSTIDKLPHNSEGYKKAKSYYNRGMVMIMKWL